MSFSECRASAGLSVEEIAREFRVSQQTVRVWEQGLATPPSHVLNSLKMLGTYAPLANNALQTHEPQLPLGDRTAILLTPGAKPTALEDAGFPFERISEIAEVESWRKEINRPIYHIHKWWAQRLGTVFRAIIIGAFAPKGSDVLRLFYEPVRIPDAMIFDPFMGSGTTIGEALKLGARAIGRDINPVAYFLVRNAMAVHDRAAVLRTFDEVKRDVWQSLRHYYRTTLPGGGQGEVLYYFWVKTVGCPSCSQHVDLFSTYVFARHAYPKRHPDAQAVCPGCGGISATRYDATETTCETCRLTFNPQDGPAKGQHARCNSCQHEFSIAKEVRQSDLPPSHRLYAKLALTPQGRKIYLPATAEDVAIFKEAEEALAARPHAYPLDSIEPGYNTNQALGYNYRHWYQMFNARQLLCISMLSARVGTIDDPVLRDLFTCLLSGTLEFNNMFASYKGEGTGAVRHMFAHHILKPERVPLEANLWGTPKSSGSFSTLFEGRLRRALDYADEPFELRLEKEKGRTVAKKIYGLSEPLGHTVSTSYADFQPRRRVYLSCGNSADTDLLTGSVDAVITDPPFFDNVHYSELADFFHVWQRHTLGHGPNVSQGSTRSASEVQDSDVQAFTTKLGKVFAEAHRVLKDDGLLAFSYHHSRQDGWRSILAAIMEAGFWVSAVQPIKSEMSVAMPKNQAKEPIDLDVIMVCRKRTAVSQVDPEGDLWSLVSPDVIAQVDRFTRAGRRLSRNDIRVVAMAQTLRHLSYYSSTASALERLEDAFGKIDEGIEHLHANHQARI
ncbi:DNA methyltransferase [Sphingosinicella sp. LHD-64]|uniref:DNA methyltransferase n=1 Tax=Sphingosinicella sp. LHD-64 TaxID=3072139 RepID=UPI00280D8A89|nr:DNA methyltransferase [Sphingosinicella sp. LHD-64]MDQ8755730.1 DNA methyltransferase [Sphingosinicella sp. LHD-64]